MESVMLSCGKDTVDAVGEGVIGVAREAEDEFRIRSYPRSLIALHPALKIVHGDILALDDLQRVRIRALETQRDALAHPRRVQDARDLKDLFVGILGVGGAELL